MSVLSDPIGEVKDGAVGPVVCCWDVDGVGPVVAFLDADPCAAVAFLFVQLVLRQHPYLPEMAVVTQGKYPPHLIGILQ